MFELFRRVKTIVSAELQSMIDKAEDPVVMIDQFLREMKLEIDEFERSTAKVLAEQKLLAKKCAEADDLMKKREQQALLALEADQEELARRALQDKKSVEQDLATLRALYEESTRNLEEFKLKLREMKAEYRELEMKKETLKARAATAKVKARFNQSLSALEGAGAKAGFERMEHKVLEYEALADASEQLRSDQQSNLDKEFEKLELNHEIDQELNALKAKLQKKTAEEE